MSPAIDHDRRLFCPDDGAELREVKRGVHVCQCDARLAKRYSLSQAMRDALEADTPREGDETRCAMCGIRMTSQLRLRRLAIWIPWCEHCDVLWLRRPEERILDILRTAQRMPNSPTAFDTDASGPDLPMSSVDLLILAASTAGVGLAGGGMEIAVDPIAVLDWLVARSSEAGESDG